ncbi:MAG: deaminase domain-containing protein, partial [Flammeovirgaceae bacterium]
AFDLGTIATEVAWDIAFSSAPLILSYVKTAGTGIKASLNRIEAYREGLQLTSNNQRRRNMAFADIKVNGEVSTLVSISGSKTRPLLIEAPTNRNFTTFETPRGHLRSTDSEAKLLEAIAARYADNPKIKGTINLFTERRQCDSCRGVIDQFKAMFPNIKLKIGNGGV